MLYTLPAFDNRPLDASRKTVLVAGASRGIGLAMVEALLKPVSPDDTVPVIIAACRQPEHAADLRALQQAHPDCLALVSLDIAVPESIGRMVDAIRPITSRLDQVINTVGVLHEPASAQGEPALRPEKALSQLRPESLLKSFAVNAWGPMLLAQALMPLISRQHAFVFASLSARVGSIGDNQLGGWYSYRAAKAAQNQFLKTWSIELQRTHPLATVLILHPGTTDTLLSKPFSAHVAPDKLFPPARVAADLLAVMASRTPADSGSFLDWANQPVPW